MNIAERIPVARVGTIEIRPVLEISGLPNTAENLVNKQAVKL